MENPEEVLSWLEEAARRRPATIPRELDDYLAWVARTGEPVYSWALVRPLLKEKLLQVLQDFRSQGPPPPTCSRNVPPFDPEAMRVVALARLDAFPAPPFTIQRICELLAHPRRHYNRLDKFMRAFEKNVLVVSTKEPEPPRRQPAPAAPAPAPTPAPASAYENDNDRDDDADADADDFPYLRAPRAPNGPLLRRHDASSSAERQTRVERDSPPEDERSKSPDEAAKPPEPFPTSPGRDSDYKDAYEQISPGEDTVPPQTTDERIAGAADTLARFSAAAAGAPLPLDDPPEAKPEEESRPEDGSTSPVEVDEPPAMVERAPETVSESIQNIDECAQDDAKESEEINVDHVESDSTSSPLSGAESDSCPTRTQSDDSSEPSFENMIEKSPPSAEILPEDVDLNPEPANVDIAENAPDENVDITDVPPENQTPEPTPMDCTEENVEMPVQPILNDDSNSNSDEKMITDDDLPEPQSEPVSQE